MDIKFLFGWAKEEGVELPTKSDGSIDIPAAFDLYKRRNGSKKKENAQSESGKEKREYQAHVSARYRVNGEWKYNSFTEHVDAVSEDDAKERLKEELGKQGYSNMKFSEVMPND